MGTAIDDNSDEAIAAETVLVDHSEYDQVRDTVSCV